MGTKNHPGEIDCYAKAHPDEPLFVLLARDSLAPSLVRQWADHHTVYGILSSKAAEALRVADAMEAWARSPKTPAPHSVKLLTLTDNEYRMLRATGRDFVPLELHPLALPATPVNAWAIQAIEDLRRRGMSDVPPNKIDLAGKDADLMGFGGVLTPIVDPLHGIEVGEESPADKLFREAPAILEKMIADAPTLHDKFMLAAVTGLSASVKWAKFDTMPEHYASELATIAGFIAAEAMKARAKVTKL